MHHKTITPQALKHRAIAQYHHTTRIIIMAVALALSMIAFSASAQDSSANQVAALRKQVGSFFLRNTLHLGEKGSACEINYAVVSFKINPANYRLDSVNLESNLPDEIQGKIAQLLTTVSIDWKTLAGQEGLDGRVVRMPFLIKSTAKKCRNSGSISAAAMGQLMTGMIGSAEQGDKLFGQSIFLPLYEILITRVDS